MERRIAATAGVSACALVAIVMTSLTYHYYTDDHPRAVRHHVGYWNFVGRALAHLAENLLVISFITAIPLVVYGFVVFGLVSLVHLVMAIRQKRISPLLVVPAAVAAVAAVVYACMREVFAARLYVEASLLSRVITAPATPLIFYVHLMLYGK